jgi:SAM-dependent methyltransferase
VISAERLRDGVRRAYSLAAEEPERKHPFPVGRRFAESLGYPRDLLGTLPTPAIEAFSGVSNVRAFAEIREGHRVLDLGCGAGLDTLIAAQRAGARGKAIGLDFSAAMLARARHAAGEMKARNIFLCLASGESLPLEDGCLDRVLINGIFNLNPYREAIFRELARVLRPSGQAYVAELILTQPLPQESRATENDWFA